MNALANAAQSQLLEPSVLEFIHQLEVWYMTALQAQPDAPPATGLLKLSSHRSLSPSSVVCLDEGDGSTAETDAFATSSSDDDNEESARSNTTPRGAAVSAPTVG